MKNWFNTLNEALEAEDLIHTWDCSRDPIAYDTTVSYTFEDGSRYGHFVTIFRDERGMYERPVHYAR